MSPRSIVKLGFALLCMSVVSAIVFFSSKNVRKQQITELNAEVASLTERVDELQARAGVERPITNEQLLADIAKVSSGLASLEARISRPNHLSNAAFFSSFVLSYCGGLAIMVGMKRRSKEKHKSNSEIEAHSVG